MNYLPDRVLRRFWSKILLPDEDGCMLWAAGKFSTGYGQFWTGSRREHANRLSLVLAEGEPASSDMHAAHSCRNRACVAPAHLRWASAAENEADKVLHGVASKGERHGRAKLSFQQVLAIREAHASGSSSRADIAREYGMDPSHISAIVSGRAWAEPHVAQEEHLTT